MSVLPYLKLYFCFTLLPDYFPISVYLLFLFNLFSCGFLYHLSLSLFICLNISLCPFIVLFHIIFILDCALLFYLILMMLLVSDHLVMFICLHHSSLPYYFYLIRCLNLFVILLKHVFIKAFIFIFFCIFVTLLCLQALLF